MHSRGLVCPEFRQEETVTGEVVRHVVRLEFECIVFVPDELVRCFRGHPDQGDDHLWSQRSPRIGIQWQCLQPMRLQAPVNRMIGRERAVDGDDRGFLNLGVSRSGAP